MDKDDFGPVKVYGVYFHHTYKVNGFFEPTIRRHDCLNSGYWCAKNALRHPQDIIKYLKKRSEAAHSPKTTKNKIRSRDG